MTKVNYKSVKFKFKESVFRSSCWINMSSHQSSKLPSSLNNYFSAAVEEDVDSDVLSDSENEDEREKINSLQSSSLYDQIDNDMAELLNDGDEGDAADHRVAAYLQRKQQQQEEDDQIYQWFVQSVHNEEYAESVLGRGSDEDDDDDDFNPDQEDHDYSEDEDDEETADLEDLVNSDDEKGNNYNKGTKVQPHELRDLVNECWLEIAGKKPNVPQNYPPTYLTKQNTSGSSLLSASLNSSDEEDGEEENETVVNNSSSMNLLSSVVSQFVAGQKQLSETFIDNLPVNCIRKILARQMSMALQLLIQILLQAENHSECFDKCYQHLLILSNLRNSAVKKAKLFQSNFELLKSLSQDTNRIKLLKENEFQQILMEVVPQGVVNNGTIATTANVNGNNSNGTVDQKNNLLLQRSLISNSHHLSSTNLHNRLLADTSKGINSRKSSSSQPRQQQEQRIMTRSSYNQLQQTNERTSSIFDHPILSKIHEFMKHIDEKKRYISNELLPFLSASSFLSSSSSSFLQARLHYDHQLKILKFQLYEKYIKLLYAESSLKCWNSLIPKANYPFLSYSSLLSPSFAASSSSVSYSILNPLTIEGRKFFTPAEDDLLLKGIIEFTDEGSENWEKIQKKYLPFKKMELLQFHYHEKTLFSSLLQRNDFKRFFKLYFHFCYLSFIIFVSFLCLDICN
jgi:hypothetical protein